MDMDTRKPSWNEKTRTGFLARFAQNITINTLVKRARTTDVVKERKPTSNMAHDTARPVRSAESKPKTNIPGRRAGLSV